ncbi:aminomethyl-transferring glycine dehydrogenase subunit GcvPB [Geoalkalibacter halelectricus]|uniref:Probable glycine dehydrogenase (decarboxylating) subunit 2 n=1 Tax=Geoalkalibacter halelectricus TaxID=2847045 RepID=A0ABY5ZGK8_9BACT|nr:aminomethyl-transferring glycine dehydrogenase subunit GcvPB [Geoalkalibacter halelectricus]MDO3380159.1 aminomethyl-transferring glycine dehydrogenase subunit GcvPB [Geoalkalibacter halelectricus]UWZ78267.1 aminomethyl-transferring glycine dehydrogenase subunit GcvPB [Geoalkalibacter halelectricus]
MTQVGTSGLQLNEKLLFEHSDKGRKGYSLPALDVPAAQLPAELVRTDIRGFPELSELDVVRHFTRLSTWNYGVDSGFYPLGSCTMKYNPKVNEVACRLPGFAGLHPHAPEDLSQGALELMYQLQQDLAETSGLPAVTLQPGAGAHGELAGMLMIRAWHEARGSRRGKVLIPDTAHGTNPATAALCGYQVIPVSSEGVLRAAAVAELMDEDVAALMITNPNTLGLFESEITEICRIVHERGGLVYCDGANLNALMGISRPGDLGIDVMHFNLHKTFATPHGGGGPGAGPVGVTAELAPFLPVPVVVRDEEGIRLDFERPQSIGTLKGFYGHFGVLVRAFAYIRSLGPDGLRKATEMAVLNANYLRARLEETYHLPYKARSLHEVVFSDRKLAGGCRTLDLAKRLIDYGFHPPTIYFPLVVAGAIMIEPTESESLESIDEFCEAMLAIAREAETQPELLKEAPRRTRVGRLDETRAARRPRLRWDGGGQVGEGQE